jgi:hypothetical protein
MKLQDYIQYYIGCEVIVDDNVKAKLIGGSFVPNSCNQIYYDLQTEEMKVDDVDFAMPYNDDADDPEPRVKPILRRLEDMTDEEGVHLAKLQHNPTRHKDIEVLYIKAEHLHYIDGTRWIGDGVSEYNEYFVNFSEMKASQFSYLIECGIDLFSLIENGLAIDSKTLK